MECHSCQTSIDVDTTFCPNCGIQIINKKDSIKPKAYSESMYTNTYSAPIRRRNYFNYIGPSLIYTLFTIIISVYWSIRPQFLLDNSDQIPLIIFGFFILPVIPIIIPVLYYYYYNFSDFQKMIYKYHPNIHYTGFGPKIMLLIAIFFGPAFFYYKYNYLHNHLLLHHPEISANTKSGKYMVLLFVYIILISIFGPVFIILPILIFEGTVVGFIIAVLAIVLTILGSIAFSIYIIMLENRWQIQFNDHLNWHDGIQ